MSQTLDSGAWCRVAAPLSPSCLSLGFSLGLHFLPDPPYVSPLSVFFFLLDLCVCVCVMETDKERNNERVASWRTEKSRFMRLSSAAVVSVSGTADALMIEVRWMPL